MANFGISSFEPQVSVARELVKFGMPEGQGGN
jgi:hypothetical protein